MSRRNQSKKQTKDSRLLLQDNVSDDIFLREVINLSDDIYLDEVMKRFGSAELRHYVGPDRDEDRAWFLYENRRFGLHHACETGYNNGNDIRELLEVFPQAAQLPDANGWYPLHIACDNDQSEDVISMLIEIHPEAVAFKLPDASGGCYPLHIACQKRHHDVIMKLLEVFPQAAHYQDVTGQYPLHIACDNNQSEDVIFKLIEIYPDAVAKKVLVDDHPMVNPLQLLARRDDNANVVKYLLQLPDLDVNATNNYGNSALHIAINWKSFDIVDALLRHPFIMIDQRNHDNKTPFNVVNKHISRLQKLDDNQSLLPKYQQVKKQLQDHWLMTRWGSFEYFYQNIKDWSMKQ